MKKYLLIGLLGFLFFGAAERVQACSCLMPAPGMSVKKQVANAKRSATAIFEGKVISIRFSEEKMNGTPVKAFATIQVERSWKGPVSNMIEVETANICCICGYTFEEGKSYLIYSNSADAKSLSVSSCSRTQLLVGKNGDAKYLGRSKVVKKQ